MVNYVEARAEFDKVVRNHGTILQIKYFNASGATSGYDDEVVLTQSGNTVWVSGMFDTAGKNSNEALMLQQGRLLQDDQKAYIPGSVSLTGIYRVGVGSPSSIWYSVIGEMGVQKYDINGQTVYNKAYLRVMPNGSIYGE